MPRYRDDDDDYDRRGSGSGTKTVFIIVGIIGGVCLLVVVGCMGLFGFAIYQAKNQFQAFIDVNTNSEKFLEHTQAKQFNLAYQMTSKGYKARVSEDQFKKLVETHPLMTAHKGRFEDDVNYGNNNKTNGSFKNATISYKLTEDAFDDDDEFDPDDEKKAPPKPNAPKKKSIIVKIRMVDENGKWVIDEWTVEHSP